VAAFVAGIFTDALGRPPGPVEPAYWESQVQAAGRSALVGVSLTTAEAVGGLLQGYDAGLREPTTRARDWAGSLALRHSRGTMPFLWAGPGCPRESTSGSSNVLMKRSIPSRDVPAGGSEPFSGRRNGCAPGSGICGAL
jgi:hypothetical protein